MLLNFSHTLVVAQKAKRSGPEGGKREIPSGQPIEGSLDQPQALNKKDALPWRKIIQGTQNGLLKRRHSRGIQALQRL